jgi:hypothetical protein
MTNVILELSEPQVLAPLRQLSPHSDLPPCDHLVSIRHAVYRTGAIAMKLNAYPS